MFKLDFPLFQDHLLNLNEISVNLSLLLPFNKSTITFVQEYPNDVHLEAKKLDLQSFSIIYCTWLFDSLVISVLSSIWTIISKNILIFCNFMHWCFSSRVWVNYWRPATSVRAFELVLGLEIVVVFRKGKISGSISESVRQELYEHCNYHSFYHNSQNPISAVKQNCSWR